MKRALSLLLVLCMLCGMLASVAVAEETENTGATITVGSVDAAPGEKVEVPVKLTNNPGFAGFTFDVEFDKEALTLKEIKSDLPKITGLDEIENFTADVTTKTETYFNAENVTGNQTLMTLVFEVNAAATAGSYNVSVKLHDDQPTNFCNAEAAAVPVTFVAGSVTVTNGDETPADAPTIVVASGKAKTGSNVSVDVKVENNPGVSSMALEFSYDPEKLQLASIEKGAVASKFSMAIDPTEVDKTVNPFRYGLSNFTGAVADDGVLLTLNFTVLENAEVGETEVAVSIEEAWNGDDAVDFKTKNGVLNIRSFTYGDVNDDGSIDMRDVEALGKVVCKVPNAPEIVHEAGDVTLNGTVDMRDVTRLGQYVCKIIKVLLPETTTSSQMLRYDVAESMEVSDANTAILSIDNVNEAHRNETISMTVNVKDNPGVSSMALEFSYDPEKLQLASIEKGAVASKFSMAIDPTEVDKTVNPFRYGLSNFTGAVADDGVLLTLNFTVLENAEVGETEVAVSIEEAWNGDDAVSFSTENGTVKITCEHAATRTFHPATDATCETPGNIAYYQCECGVYFAVATGGEPLTESDVFIAALGHDLEHYEKQDATCTATGVEEHYICQRTDCGKVFDSTRVTETTLEALTIPVKGHAYDLVAEKPSTCTEHGTAAHYVCSNCQGLFKNDDDKTPTTLNELKLPLAAHAYEEKVDTKYLKSNADCENAAVYYKSCKNCEAKSDETFTSGSPLGHNGQKVDEVPATCTEDGVKGHYECSRCGKKFQDEECTTVADNAWLKISASGHSLSDWVNDNPDYHWKKCTNSGCEYTEGKASHNYGDSYSCDSEATCTICGYVKPAGIHDYEWTTDKEATCEESGHQNGTCKNCGATTERAIDPKGHNKNPEYHAQVDPTCTEQGMKAYYKCPDCKIWFKDKDCKNKVAQVDCEIPATGHDPKNVPATEATCGVSGNLEYWVCENCGKLFKDEACKTETTLKDVTLPALVHQYEQTAEDDDTYTYTCKNCGDTYTEDKVKLPVLPGKLEFPGNQFTDVDKSDWFYFDVKYVSDRGIMDGTGNGEFSPYADLNRAMIVTILYRMEGKPAVSTANTFTDVPSGQWYSEAIEWAASKGIVLGYGNGTYGPFDAVTREQLAAILYRYATLKGYDVKGDFKLDADASYSAWSKANVEWAANKGILVDGLSVNATKTANRAEVARSIRSFLTRVAK